MSEKGCVITHRSLGSSCGSSERPGAAKHCSERLSDITSVLVAVAGLQLRF